MSPPCPLPFFRRLRVCVCELIDGVLNSMNGVSLCLGHKMYNGLGWHTHTHTNKRSWTALSFLTLWRWNSVKTCPIVLLKDVYVCVHLSMWVCATWCTSVFAKWLSTLIGCWPQIQFPWYDRAQVLPNLTMQKCSRNFNFYLNMSMDRQYWFFIWL